MAEHEFLCRGARVRVRDGEVEVLTDPAVSYCPYVAATYGVKRIDRAAVARIVRMKMERFGFCCPHRRFVEKLIVPFGSSEMMSVCLRRGLLDCAVTVCEGAGTVIASDPGLVQGIGAMLNGILRTSPLEPVIRHIEARGGVLLDREEAVIDQVAGVEEAICRGFKRIAVTVIGPRASIIPKLRELEAEHEGVRLAIFSTCNTLVEERDLRCLGQADVVCASASRLIREHIGPRALAQLGVSIPVFLLTPLAKELAFTYLTEVRASLVAFRARMPYLVAEKQPILARGCSGCGSCGGCR